ncbi:hypothetical protein ACLH9T_004591 [Salmonella enterica]
MPGTLWCSVIRTKCFRCFSRKQAVNVNIKYKVFRYKKMTTTVLTDAKNERYGESGIIMVDVRFDDLTAADGSPLFLPYIATKYDPEPYGVQLYNDLASGKYGQIVPFTTTPAQRRKSGKTRRNQSVP